MDNLSWFFLLPALGIQIYYLINCFKLRKVNGLRKKMLSDVLFQDSIECAEWLSKIKNSENLDDLNGIFGSMIEKWPQWEKQISQIYNKKKEQLLQNS